MGGGTRPLVGVGRWRTLLVLRLTIDETVTIVANRSAYVLAVYKEHSVERAADPDAGPVK